MVIPHMADVEIDMIHAKIFKALIQVIFNVLLPADPGINFFLCTRGKLCGNHIFIAPCKIPERLPDKPLTGSILIGNRRIIKIDAKLQTMLYDLPCPAFIHCPAMLSGSRIAKSHTPHTYAGHF